MRSRRDGLVLAVRAKLAGDLRLFFLLQREDAQISEIAVEALRRYAAEVREGKFPDAEHSYDMKPEERQELARLVSQGRTAR